MVLTDKNSLSLTASACLAESAVIRGIKTSRYAYKHTLHSEALFLSG